MTADRLDADRLDAGRPGAGLLDAGRGGVDARSDRRRVVRGTVAASVGVVSFSLTFPGTLWAMEGMGALTAGSLRCVAAGALAAVLLAVFRVRVPERRHWWGLVGVGVGCVLGFPLLTALALRTTSSGHSAVVIGALPLATAVYGVLRGRRAGAPVPGRLFWVAAVAGAAVVVGFAFLRGAGLPSGGDLYLFAALVVCAVGYGEGGRLARLMPGWQVIAWGLVVSLPVSVPVLLAGLSVEGGIDWSWKSAAGLAYTTVASQFGGLVVWYVGIALLGAARASQLQLTQPLLTLGWSAVLLGEAVGPSTAAAALAVLGCVVLTQRARA